MNGLSESSGEGAMEAKVRRATVTERLNQERVTLIERLGQVEEALQALAENPQLERVLNLVSKVSRY